MGHSNHRKQSDVPVKHKLKKDPGVPKLPDLKVRVRQHTKRPDVPLERRFDNDTQMASEPTLSTLAALAAESSSEVPEDPSSSTPSRQKTREQLRRYYLKSLHKVIDESDIILLVMDARDPEGCRSRLVEEEVRRRESEGKRLVFVLNKIDLVPKANAQAWLKYLRHSTPTLPFLSGSQNSRSNITSSTAPALMKLLKAYKPKTKSVTVGVVGYPNVGKSSLINCLKRSKVCSVAAQPGHTKDLQSIQIERGLKVIDSRMEEILLRTPRETLQKIYSLPEFGTTLEFLTMLALSSGRLLKGGTPDLNSAARQILMDWNQQKIPYCSQPPEIHPSDSSLLGAAGAAAIAPGAEQVGQAQILDTLSKPFELDGLFNAIDADVQMDADGDGGFIPDEPMDAEDPNQMESDDLKPHIPRKRSRSPSLVSESAVPTSGPTSEDPSYMHRQPKRQRKSKEIPEYNEQPDKHGALKKDAKRQRKMAKMQSRAEMASG
ncbi:P-loop containing nucleoside triphosphate hydrolase protein, partial [Coprinopsis sp. MPI-PUGE-AT-0042]